MPTADGKFKGISVPNVPWSDKFTQALIKETDRALEDVIRELRELEQQDQSSR